MAELRNVVLVSHSGVGKTTLAESMSFDAGASKRRGSVGEGNTTSDFDDEEIARHFSISASLLRLNTSGKVVNLIDTPGTLDFSGEVVGGIYAADAAVALVSAVAGVETGTVRCWDIATDRGLPRALFINRMDRENANFAKAMETCQAAFGKTCVPVQLPIGAHTSFKGLVDLIANKAYVYATDGSDDCEVTEIPAELADAVAQAREKLIDAVAAADDALIEKYLDQGTLSASELHGGLAKAFLEGAIHPIFVGAAELGIGSRPLLDAITDYFPAPGQVPPPRTLAGDEEKALPEGALAALIFKTTVDPFAGKLSLVRVFRGTLSGEAFNVNRGKNERCSNLFNVHGNSQESVGELTEGDIGAIAKLELTLTGDTLAKSGSPRFAGMPLPQPLMKRSVFPASKGDEDKMSTGLSRLQEEDPTLHSTRNDQTKEMILAGLGDQHLQVAVARLQKKYGVNVELKIPRIAYLETITRKAEGHGRHKKQTGGRGQFGDCQIEFWPLERGKGVVFEDAVVGGVIPNKFIPAVEKGLNEAYANGYLCGCPIVDIHARLFYGSYHSVDSSEMAFKVAASLAFKDAMTRAAPVVLEPIMRVEVFVPDEFMGDIAGDISSKRGKILGMEPRGKMQVVRALVPEGELSNYSTELRSMTGGQGTYSLEFNGYEQAPSEIQQRIVEEHKREKE
ncbi:MAG TPA: elongation factor G [bacterium]|nr:elongation factor G [bacterium]